MDGCITNDGDAFLYGARTVYKDLCISGKVGYLQINSLSVLHYRYHVIILPVINYVPGGDGLTLNKSCYLVFFSLFLF